MIMVTTSGTERTQGSAEIKIHTHTHTHTTFACQFDTTSGMDLVCLGYICVHSGSHRMMIVEIYANVLIATALCTIVVCNGQ